MSGDIVAKYMAQAEELRQRITQERLSLEAAIFTPERLQGWNSLEVSPEGEAMMQEQEQAQTLEE